MSSARWWALTSAKGLQSGEAVDGVYDEVPEDALGIKSVNGHGGHASIRSWHECAFSAMLRATMRSRAGGKKEKKVTKEDEVKKW